MFLPLLCILIALVSPAIGVRVQSWQNPHCVGKPEFSRPLVDGVCNPFNAKPLGDMPAPPVAADPSAPPTATAMSVKCNPADNTFLVRFFTDAQHCDDHFNVVAHEFERAGGVGNGECFLGQKPNTSYRVFCNDADYTLGPENDSDPAVLMPPKNVPLPIPTVNTPASMRAPTPTAPNAATHADL